MLSCVQRFARPSYRIATSHRTSLSAFSPARPSTLCRSMFAGPGSDKLLQQSLCDVVCDKDTPLVADEELPELLAAVPSWKHDRESGRLVRKFTAKNFMAAIKFFNKVAEVAEAEGHHPDLHLANYREVEIHVYTHTAHGVTKYDFVLAAKLDRIDVDYSPKWLQQHQQLYMANTSSK